MRRMNETADELDRWSSWKKMEAVLSLSKGENLDSLSQGLEVSAATLSPWRDVFLTDGLNGLKSPTSLRALARSRNCGRLSVRFH